MRKKLLTFILLMMAVVSLFVFHAGAADVVDAFADDMRAFKSEITVPVRDFDALMKETFTRYPELVYYYSNCTYWSDAEGLRIEMNYQNTDKDLDDVYIVDSEDELLAVIGLLMCDLGDGVDVLLINGYEVDSQSIYDRLYEDYYLIAQGLNFRFNNGVAWNAYGITYYNITLFYCSDTPRETVRAWRTATEQKVLELASTLFAQDMPDYMKAYLIHDWLVDNNYYDLSDYDQLQWENHCAYGTLCEGNGVCQSYSEAARMLLQAAGIPCYYVPGDGTNSAGETESHSWNCLQLGGEWYLWDTTWDDPVTSDGSAVKRYDYFLITSEQMRKDHVWDEAAFPGCTATALNYDRVMELIAADTNTYTDYSTGLVRTEAIQRAELEALLGGAEDAIAEPEEPVEEPEEPIEAPEEPVEKPGELVEAPEEPAEEPEEPVEAPEEPAEEPEEPAEEPEEPVEEPVLPEELKEVILIDREKQELNARYTWVVVLIILVMTASVTVVVIRCIANSRVMEARSERRKQREARIRSNVRTHRRF